MEEQNKSFTYEYSARQQEEVKWIRDKYITKEESKMEQLRRLDQKANTRGTVISLIIGAVSTLLLGIGLSCAIMRGGDWIIPGALIGLIGIAGTCVSYPIFCRITKKEREKIAPQILKLTEELMDEH